MKGFSMSIRGKVLAAVLTTLLAGAVTAPVCAAELPTPVAASALHTLHRRLQDLDRELAGLWDGARLPPSGQDEPPDVRRKRLRDRTQRLRARLELLEIQAEAQPPDRQRALRAKIRSLRRGLGNLDLVAAGAAPSDLAAATARSADGNPTGPMAPSSLAAAVTAANACSGAPVIGDGTYTGTTVGATNDGTASCGLSDLTADVWFRYVAPADGKVSVDTFGSDFDTVLSVRTACPGSGSELRCNDDAAGLQSALSFTAQAGVSYWVRVSGVDGATGAFSLRVGTGGSVAGRVAVAGTGDPVSAGEVVVSSPLGFAIQAVPLAGDGSYTVGGLSAFGYRLHTETEQGVRDEVWNDHPCSGALLCEPTVGDPVVVASLGTTAGIDFVLDPGGAISGTVRRAANGDPVEGVRLEAWRLQSPLEPGLAVATVSLADGTYLLGGVDTGTYLVIAKSPDWVDELYDDVACPGGFDPLFPECEPAQGTSVAVTLGAAATGVDFDLVRLGIFEGTVTDATTGDPLENATVEVQSQGGGTLGSALTDSSGAYRIAGLPSGAHYLHAEAAGFLSEAYPETDCPRLCRPAQSKLGTPVPLALDQVVSGLDFTLTRQGSISGSWTDAVTGDPISQGRVRVFSSDGVLLSDGFFIDPGGAYRVTEIPAGDHFVVAAPSFTSGYLTELYDDIPCFANCDLTTGTPVTVASGADTPGIDFALDRAGTITGTLTDVLTGAPIINRRVGLYDLDGLLRSSVQTSDSGTYAFENLRPASYLVLTNTFVYVDQLYDGVPCFEGLFLDCKPGDGTPVQVTANSTVGGIDFALEAIGSISGRVSDAISGAGIADGSVEIFDRTGDEIDFGFIRGNGVYVFDRVAPGDYFVRVQSSGYLGEVFDDLLCAPSCDVTAGTPVTVAPGAAVTGIDFQLGQGTSITGRVVDAVTGEPIVGADVRVQNAEGLSFGSGFSDGDGNYRSPRLAPGTYALLILKFPYLAEVYDDLLCTQLDFGFQCPVAKGTPVTVTLAGDTTGIDFELELLNAGLTGIVLDQTTGRPVAGVGVQIWDGSGNPVQRFVTRHDGVWLADLPPGTYFASTDAPGFFDQVYDGVECGATCNPLTGTPIPVATSSTVVRSIDFRLGRTPSIFTDGFESGDVSAWSPKTGGSP